MTRSGTSQPGNGGSDHRSLPLLFVLALGILFQGGDWPPATFLVRAVLFLLLAAFLFRADSFAIRPTVPDLLVVLFLGVEAASLVRADYRWVSYQWFLHHAAAAALYALLRAAPGRDDRFPGAAAVLLLAVVAVEVSVALYQRIVPGNSRPDGTLANPNVLAEILLYAAIGAFFLRESLARRGLAARRWLAPLVVLFAGGIVLTGSRGGVLVSLAVAAWLAARRFGWKRAIAGAAIAGGAAALVLGAVSGRMPLGSDPYAFERISMWKAALRIFADHPFGVGTGHFKYFWPAFRDPVEGSLIRFARFAATPHNEFFSVLSELGLPGAAAFLGLSAAGIVSLGRAARSSDPVASGAATILFASFLSSIVQANYHIVGILLVNAVALSIVSGRLWSPAWSGEIRLKGILRPAAVVLLAAMVAYSASTLAGTLLEWSGRRALEAGRLRDAERRFLQAAAVDPWQSSFPDDASAVQYRLYGSRAGDAYLSRAIESELEASARNPVDFRYPFRLGFLYAAAVPHFPGAGKGAILGASLAACEKAIMLNPHSAEIRYQKAAVLRMAGRRKESLRLIEDVLSEEPRYARGWAVLGELLEGDDPKRAVAAYEKAANLYYTYEKSAIDPEEKEFMTLDVKAVEARVRALKAGAGG